MMTGTRAASVLALGPAWSLEPDPRREGVPGLPPFTQGCVWGPGVSGRTLVSSEEDMRRVGGRARWKMRRGLEQVAPREETGAGKERKREEKAGKAQGHGCGLVQRLGWRALQGAAAEEGGHRRGTGACRFQWVLGRGRAGSSEEKAGLCASEK